MPDNLATSRRESLQVDVQYLRSFVDRELLPCRYKLLASGEDRQIMSARGVHKLANDRAAAHFSHLYLFCP